MDAVLETVRTPQAAIKPIGAARAFVLRDRTIPLIALGEVLGVSSGPAPAPEAPVVIVSVGGQIAGLEVDRLGVRMDVMLKPVEGLLAGAPGVAGTTLLGDGRVLIVLELQGLLD
jgi:two-component system chemotaxis sensor kinase CheA